MVLQTSFSLNSPSLYLSNNCKNHNNLNLEHYKLCLFQENLWILAQIMPTRLINKAYLLKKSWNLVILSSPLVIQLGFAKNPNLRNSTWNKRKLLQNHAYVSVGSHHRGNCTYSFTVGFHCTIRVWFLKQGNRSIRMLFDEEKLWWRTCHWIDDGGRRVSQRFWSFDWRCNRSRWRRWWAFLDPKCRHRSSCGSGSGSSVKSLATSSARFVVK